MGKFGSINQNCQFKLEFGIYTNLNMQNSMVVLTFSVLYRKHFFGKRRQTKRNYSPCDLTGAETLRQAAVVNTVSLFRCGECVRGLFLCIGLNVNKLFLSHESIFCLKN